MKRKLVARRQPVVQLQQAAVLREGRVGRALAEDVRANAQKAVDGRMRVEAAAGAEERRLRNELDAPADRVAAELRAARAANHLDRAQVAGVVEVEEGVDAAARRRRRKAYPVNVVHLLCPANR